MSLPKKRTRIINDARKIEEKILKSSRPNVTGTLLRKNDGTEAQVAVGGIATAHDAEVKKRGHGEAVIWPQ